VTAVESGNIQPLDKDVEDTTALNDVDSGLQMAMSPCSALSTSSAACTSAAAAAQHKNDVAVMRTGTFGHSGVYQCNCHSRVNSAAVRLLLYSLAKLLLIISDRMPYFVYS